MIKDLAEFKKMFPNCTYTDNEILDFLKITNDVLENLNFLVPLKYIRGE